jgi:hypothetical protein
LAKKNATEEQRGEEGLLKTAAKTVGNIVGKVASGVGAVGSEDASAAPRKKSAKVPKLAPKNKSRLPRREKKAKQKAMQATRSR